MALLDEFDSIWTAIFHRKPLLSLDVALQKMISKKTQRHTIALYSTDMVLTTPCQTRPLVSSASKSTIECKYCYHLGHTNSECHKLQRKKGGQGQHIWNSSLHIAAATDVTSPLAESTAATSPRPTSLAAPSALFVADLEAIVS